MLFDLSFEPKHEYFVPSKEDCFALWDKYEMLENIREHSLMVAKVALFLYEQANNLGYNINKNYVLASALLHDIAKTYTIKHGGDHTVLGGAFIRDETENPYLSHAIISHALWPWNEGEMAVWNKPWRLPLLISHADKRICHCQVVDIDTRFDDLQARYGTDEHRRAIIHRDRLQSRAHAKALQAHGFNIDVSAEILEKIVI